jgi:hypothetical protein
MIFALAASLILHQDFKGPVWEPGKTWALVIGTLEWEDKESFASFPKKDRRDEALVEVMKKRGVPAAQIIYLQDRDATSARIAHDLGNIATRVGLTDTLIVYYCGHGYMDKGAFSVASYDAGIRGAATTGQSIIDTLNRGFSGKAVWLLADCCYSGQFARMVRKTQTLPATVMASASPDIESTGNWTFSDVVVDALNGMAYVDISHDGITSVKEVMDTIAKDMKFAEKQESDNYLDVAFPRNLILAKADKPTGTRVGQRVVVKWEGENYKARIIEAKDGKFLVRWFGYDADEESWVTPEDIVKVWK